MKWTNYFKFIKLEPGIVVVPGYGKIDFRNRNIPVELCKKLYDSGFPYLELTTEGKEELYGSKENKPVDKTTKPKSPVKA